MIYIEHHPVTAGWVATCDECGWKAGPCDTEAEAHRAADQHDLEMGEVRPDELKALAVADPDAILPGEVDAGTEDASSRDSWPPDDDDEARSHHRELWDELAAREEQDKQNDDEEDPEELAQQQADEAQEREERAFMGKVDEAEREVYVAWQVKHGHRPDGWWFVVEVPGRPAEEHGPFDTEDAMLDAKLARMEELEP